MRFKIAKIIKFYSHLIIIKALSFFNSQKFCNTNKCSIFAENKR